MERPHVFRTRNSFYIRISPNCVLQMILYVDHRHVHWMSDIIFERIMGTLKGRINVKLAQENSTAKSKGTVDVYRGGKWLAPRLLQKAHSRE